MITITVTVDKDGEESSYTTEISDHTGMAEELAVIGRSLAVDGQSPTLARVLASLILPGLNVAMETYIDGRYKARISELRNYLR